MRTKMFLYIIPNPLDLCMNIYINDIIVMRVDISSRKLTQHSPFKRERPSVFENVSHTERSASTSPSSPLRKEEIDEEEEEEKRKRKQKKYGRGFGNKKKEPTRDDDDDDDDDYDDEDDEKKKRRTSRNNVSARVLVLRSAWLTLPAV
ncbi:hypothetical protein HZH68_015307 [Vespula germanica]|uniref:Uncharacterized protein n=1 Tax=Vespula germanica TaxID=30212 RepID=A0A834J6B4_VESGE|nr:hypothetical protein HZH68_015307 [Vespula germanica]